MKKIFFSIILLAGSCVLFSQEEKTFRVEKKKVVEREGYRTVTLPPYQPNTTNTVLLDSNLIPGDTIKMNSQKYSIYEMGFVYSNKGEIFKMNSRDGVITTWMFSILQKMKSDDSFSVTIILEKVIDAEGNIVTTSMSYRVNVN